MSSSSLSITPSGLRSFVRRVYLRLVYIGWAPDIATFDVVQKGLRQTFLSADLCLFTKAGTLADLSTCTKIIVNVSLRNYPHLLSNIHTKPYEEKKNSVPPLLELMSYRENPQKWVSQSFDQLSQGMGTLFTCQSYYFFFFLIFFFFAETLLCKSQRRKKAKKKKLWCALHQQNRIRRGVFPL